MNALFLLRLGHFRRGLQRRLRNAAVYVQHWQDAVIYLYAAVAFLGGPLTYLLAPSLIPEGYRRLGGMLLLGLSAVLWALALYQAVFAAVDRFPTPSPLGDVQFVLLAPVGRRAYLADRLLWGSLQSSLQAVLLIPAAWALGRAFLPPWGWPEALQVGVLYLLVRAGALATSLLIYGLPRALLEALRVMRAVAGGLALFLLIAVTVMPRPPVSWSAGSIPPGGLEALPDLAPVVKGLLAPAAAWAILATALLLLLGSFNPAALAADLVRAERLRLERMSGQRLLDAQAAPGLARTSLQAWWGRGALAVAWRQLAAYRHRCWQAWVPVALSLLAVAGAPTFMAAIIPGAAGGLLVVAPVMVAVSVAASLATLWRQELRDGWARQLLPLTQRQLVQGAALCPGLLVGMASTAGVGLQALRGTWGPTAWLVGTALALTASGLVALLALHEEWLAAGGVAGTAEARQAGKALSLVAAGAPALVGGELLGRSGLPLEVTLTCLVVMVMAEAVLLMHYLTFRLATERHEA